jgi:hypothetical protein
MLNFDVTIKILDVIIKSIALIFPLVLFRKQIVHFSNLISTDISIVESRSVYFPKGTIGIECTKGKLINTCLSLLLIEGKKCTPICFSKINGFSYLNLGHISEKSSVTLELTDTNIFDLLKRKLSAKKDVTYLLVLVTYSEKYDRNVFVKEKLFTIYDPGKYVPTSDDKKRNDTGLAGRDTSLPIDLIIDKKLIKNINANLVLQNNIKDEISNSINATFSPVDMAYCIPRVIYKYFSDKNRKLIRAIKTDLVSDTMHKQKKCHKKKTSPYGLVHKILPYGNLERISHRK